ncbi:DUF6731 family protein [Chromobacterium haemolyticum]|uniref:DUF6731 family protein n=1 Tax=Chromobacterium haemolyticum TaxID=394935 RepID=UPI000D3216ED|nr:DUF6731 family protein [Chromobacterium haemolyticum]PTU71475.1 hypothetical protein DBB33_19470 [Chromobacterium haemolyticum]
MKTKIYTASIFAAAFSKNDVPPDLAQDLFCKLFNDGSSIDIPSWTQKGRQYELVVQTAGAGCYKGIIKKFTKDPLPHAGKPKAQERELEIKDDESTIERSHFLYYKKNHLLVWQENRSFGQVASLSGYLSEILGQTIVFNPVLTTEATLQLLLDRHKPRVIDFSVTAPSNPDRFDATGFDGPTLRMMSDLGAMSGSFRVSANSRSMKGRFLDAKKTMTLAKKLVSSGQATKVRLELDDISHPIDLLVDRLRDKIEVDMLGRYPVEVSVYEQLAKVKDDFGEELTGIFG